MNKITIVMRKGQIVISWVIILILHIRIGYSQNNLSGLYNSLEPLQEHYETYEFDRNGTFEYHRGASLGDDEYAYGNYLIREDTLILKYKTPPLNVGYHISRIWENKSDSIVIQFDIYDFDKNPLSEVNLLLGNINSKRNCCKVGVTDKQGKVEFKLVKKNDKLEVAVSLIGFRVYKFLIDQSLSHSIDIYLQQQGLGKPVSNVADKFKIVEYQKEYLILLDNENKKIKLIKRD